MFCKLSLLTLVAPLVSALTLQIPDAPTSGGTITIKWVSAPGDPDTWSFELINTAFNNAFAIANNVDPAPQQLTLTLPVVPVGDGYTLEAVDVGNITNVFATTGSFSIGANTASISSPQSTASGTRVTGSQTQSTTRSLSATPSAPSNIVTNSNSNSNSISTPAPSQTSPNPTPTPSNGAALSRRVAAPAAVLLSGLAGAAMIAL